MENQIYVPLHMPTVRKCVSSNVCCREYEKLSGNSVEGKRKMRGRMWNESLNRKSSNKIMHENERREREKKIKRKKNEKMSIDSMEMLSNEMVLLF